MKLKFKLMAAAVALAASAGANAAILDSDMGNGTPPPPYGELFFTIYDAGATDAKDDDRAYVLDLGWLANGGLIDNWGSVASNPSVVLAADKQAFGTIYSVAADANLQSFLATSTDTSRLLWNIAAGDSLGTDRVLTTATSISLVQTPTYTQFRSGFASKIDGYLPYVNDAGIPDAGSILLSGAGAGLAAWSNNFGGGSAFSNAAGLGDSLNFFMLSEKATTGTTTKATVQQYMADANTAMQWTLAANGGLTYGAVAVAAIPEPSEYALMLAGLGMLGFMARRRLNNRA